MVRFSWIRVIFVSIKTKVWLSVERIFCPARSKFWPLNEYHEVRARVNLSFFGPPKTGPRLEQHPLSLLNCIIISQLAKVLAGQRFETSTQNMSVSCTTTAPPVVFGSTQGYKYLGNRTSGCIQQTTERTKARSLSCSKILSETMGADSTIV